MKTLYQTVDCANCQYYQQAMRAKPSNFDEFWASVPNKIGKGAARKAYKTALALATKEEIHAGLPKYAAYEASRKKQSGYRPLLPATWLNQERWTDDIAVPKTLTQVAGDAILELHKRQREEYGEYLAKFTIDELDEKVRNPGTIPHVVWLMEEVLRIKKATGQASELRPGR